DLSDKEALQNLINEPFTYSEKLTRLSIYFLGDHPGLLPPRGPGPQSPDCATKDANGNSYVYSVVAPIFGGTSTLMSVCSDTFLEWPMLEDIVNPPDWAIDPDKDQTGGPQYSDGYGCENLGDVDSS